VNTFEEDLDELHAAYIDYFDEIRCADYYPKNSIEKYYALRAAFMEKHNDQTD